MSPNAVTTLSDQVTKISINFRPPKGPFSAFIVSVPNCLERKSATAIRRRSESLMIRSIKHITPSQHGRDIWKTQVADF